MPRCYFHLRAEGKIVRDPIGTDCLDVAAAYDKATDVALDLMRNSDGNTRLWSLRVVHEHGETMFDLYFADIAAGLDGERPYGAHELTAETGRRLTALSDAVHQARRTIAESRILLARARGKPQLVHNSAYRPL
ncbi:MAG TPA: hypothetical protein VLX44_19995 [Xanthobacteraceae bacterium]|nr:hypothetical protein [Xanthobacteraceae bacterium]